MLSLLDVAERTQKGPKMEDKVWNMGLYHKMTELVDRYEIRIPADTGFFNHDQGSDLPDRLFQAAVDFLTDVGVYCLTTGRVVHFAREEVLQAAREAPSSILVGEGRDQRVIKKHRQEGGEPVNRHYGGHAPYSERLLPLVVKNFAQIPSSDYIEGFNFTNVDGREVYGMPIEAYAGRREIAWMREGVRKAGRPGMAIALYPISTRAAALIAPMDPDYGLRRTDGLLLSVLPEVKIEQDMLTAAIVYEDYGAFRLNGGGGGHIGSFAGSAGGAMIEGVVKHLTGWMCYHDLFSYSVGVEVMGRAMHSPKSRAGSGGYPMHWASHVAAQALQRHSNLILWGLFGTGWGGTAEGYLLRSAVSAIKAQVTGVNGAGGGRLTQRGIVMMDANQTPLEAELGDQVADAVWRRGTNLEQAEDLLRKLAVEMDEEAKKDDWLPGDIGEYYDLVHHRPVGEFARAYMEVRERLARLGLPLQGGPDSSV